ncbi:MAG TPA: ACT domain-containing protein [Acidimicrobiales bacterium]|nr:ACT domain-containing protein [Acidimicrobiales bacterium]
MPHFAVSAVGVDRPGIVAAVTGILVGQGCNLEDTSMSILRGHFAMMLLIAGPDGTKAEELEAALTATAGDLDLVLTVRAIDDTVPVSLQGETWTVSVYGADRPGIVYEVTKLLADAGANVVDLTTRVIGGADRPLYAMLLDVTLPPGVNGGDVRDRLDGLAGSLGVDCSMHPADADVL